MLDPRQKANIEIGTDVGVIQKKDQNSGIITKGKVKKILTSSSEHTRGIKVMLEDETTGRVKQIY